MFLFRIIGDIIATSLTAGNTRIKGADLHSNSTVSKTEISRAASKADQVLSKLKILEANLAKSMLINEALWEIIQQKLKLTEQDLIKKVNEIDMRDGQLDGKNQRKAVKCPSCDHMVSGRHPTCLYCGKVIDTSIFVIN